MCEPGLSGTRASAPRTGRGAHPTEARALPTLLPRQMGREGSPALIPGGNLLACTMGKSVWIFRVWEGRRCARSARSTPRLLGRPSQT